MTAAPCWLNGALLPVAQARIDPADRGFCLGDGIFETLAVCHGAAAHLDRHLSRLDQGAALLGLDCPYGHLALANAIAIVIAGAGQTAGSVRLTLTRGPAPRGLLPPPGGTATVLITWSDPAPRPDTVTAMLCRTTSRNEHSPLARVKSLNYLDSILARREAAQAGADDAILLNTRGHVAEASAANLFALIEGLLLTPKVEDGALPGIVRALLIERAGAVEATLTPDDLHRAEALFLTNSLGISEIRRLDTTLFSRAPGWRAWLEEQEGQGALPPGPPLGQCPSGGPGGKAPWPSCSSPLPSGHDRRFQKHQPLYRHP